MKFKHLCHILSIMLTPSIITINNANEQRVENRALTFFVTIHALKKIS